MFKLIEVKENTFVNPDQITAIVLYEHQGIDGSSYVWRFFLSSGDYVSSDEFRTKEEAERWAKNFGKVG